MLLTQRWTASVMGRARGRAGVRVVGGSSSSSISSYRHTTVPSSNSVVYVGVGLTVRGLSSTTPIGNRRTIATTPQDARLNLLPPIGCMTKVICTIGPATDSMDMAKQLVQSGMNVARLNFSHAGDDYTYVKQCFDMIRSVPGKHADMAFGRSSLSDDDEKIYNLRAVLVDTKGPEIRTGPLPGNQDVLELQTGDVVELHVDSVVESSNSTSDDNHHCIQVDYDAIANTVEVGGQVLLDDGLIALEVVDMDVRHGVVTCVALNGGPIKKNKGVNLPGATLQLPSLTDKDKRDLKWACENGADFVAASFIRTDANVRSVIAYLDRCIANIATSNNNHLNNGRPLRRPLVISKIESKEGVDNFHSILAESDGIMVARGDLGVEIPYSKVFAAQKMMIHACNYVGKPVIVATQMLDSMMRNPRPTRAEVTDVGTAVLDGADAVMLSGETAAGKYPIHSLKAMCSVVWEADMINSNTRDPTVRSTEMYNAMTPMQQELDAVASSAAKSAKDMGARLIVIITATGDCARAVSRHMPTVPVVAMCTDPQVGRRLQLHHAVTPIILQSTLDPESKNTRMGLLRAEAVRTIKELGYAKAGDRIIMVDRTVGKEGDMHDYSHNMKVVTLSHR